MRNVINLNQDWRFVREDDQRRGPGQILFPENGLVANLPIIQYARLVKYYMLILGAHGTGPGILS